MNPSTGVFSIPHSQVKTELNTDPASPLWSGAASTWILKDCSRELEYPDLKTEVKAFWTNEDLYFLFICPYRTLNVFLPPQNDQPRDKLWDRDVVEMFLGADWQNINRYREFEIAPTGDWIDLDIDFSRQSYNQAWRSGWQVQGRIDEQARRWYAAARIPLRSVTPSRVSPGTRWRMNLYRIDGEGPDTQRRFLCWQPTCVKDRDPNHVPEAFGTLMFLK
ncbi:MAG: carbohydrate-binding family 9-like protein [Acidobacteriota bacterium]